jgi:hypothetical protein
VIRAFSVVSSIVLIAGVVVVFTGALPLAILLIVLGLGGLALAFVASEAKRLLSSAREWIGLFAEGRPRSLRLVSVEAPKGFVLNPDATVTLEAESRSGVVKQHTQGVPVPRLYAFFWKLATWVRIPLPKRLDFERMVRLQLRRAEAEADARQPPAAISPS